MITYDNLWKTMKEKGFTQYRLMQYHDFSQNMFRRMKNNCHCSTYTIGRLCEVLECNIEDIITFVPDENAQPIKIVTKAELREMERARKKAAEQEENDDNMM